MQVFCKHSWQFWVWSVMCIIWFKKAAVYLQWLCHYVYNLQCVSVIILYVCTSSRTERTTLKTRKAMRWSGVNRLKKYWSIITAIMWLRRRGLPTSHDCTLSPEVLVACWVACVTPHDWLMYIGHRLQYSLQLTHATHVLCEISVLFV